VWNIGNGQVVAHQYKYILIGTEEVDLASYEIEEIWKKIELWSKCLNWSDQKYK
jgi:hypothetical protein